MYKNSVSIICPTLNEQDNIDMIYENISSIVKYDWELIFVDDNSTDLTTENIKRISRSDKRVRLISRVGRRGLSSAVSEGFLSAIYDLCIVIDADLQHDINNINTMTALAIKNSLD